MDGWSPACSQEVRSSCSAIPKPMSQSPIRRVLLIDDNPEDTQRLGEMLGEPGLHTRTLAAVDCINEAEQYLRRHAVDIILLDLGLHDPHGLEAVQRTHAVAPSVPLVVLSA